MPKIEARYLDRFVRPTTWDLVCSHRWSLSATWDHRMVIQDGLSGGARAVLHAISEPEWKFGLLACQGGVCHFSCVQRVLWPQHVSRMHIHISVTWCAGGVLWGGRVGLLERNLWVGIWEMHREGRSAAYWTLHTGDPVMDGCRRYVWHIHRAIADRLLWAQSRPPAIEFLLSQAASYRPWRWMSLFSFPKWAWWRGIHARQVRVGGMWQVR